MKYLQDNTIKDFVKDIIKDELYNYKDSSIYGCDMGYQLLENYNIDGVYFYNNYKASQFIKEHFTEFGEIVEEIKFQLGEECVPNVFNEPDKFTVVCFLEVSRYLLGCCKFIEDNWNNEIELTNENIETILKELKEV